VLSRAAADTKAEPLTEKSETRALLLMIAIATLARVALAAVLGLGYDETYDTVVARSLEFSYYDHPPAAMWLIWLTTHLFGGEASFVVRLPTLLLFAGQNYVLFLLTRRLFDARAAWFAVAAIALSPLFSNFIGMIALTDGPFMFALTCAAYALVRALEIEGRPPLGWWALAGLFLGLAMLSKFSAVLSAAAVVLYLVTTPERRRLLATPAPYLAALVAFLVFSPVLIWNAEHGWAALAFQGARAELKMNFRLARVLRDQSLGAVILGPAVWLGLVVGVASGFTRRNALLLWLALTPVVFFFVVDLFGSVTEPLHWPSPGYLFAFPLLGAAAARWSRTWPRTVQGLAWAQTVVAAGVALVVVSHAYTGWIGKLAGFKPGYDPVVGDEADWSALPATLEARGLMDPSRYVVVAGRYYFCFKAEFALRGRLPVVCLDDLPIRRSLTPKDALDGKHDAIVIETWWRAPQPLKDYLATYADVTPLTTIWGVHTGRNVMQIDLALARHEKP